VPRLRRQLENNAIAAAAPQISGAVKIASLIPGQAVEWESTIRPAREVVELGKRSLFVQLENGAPVISCEARSSAVQITCRIQHKPSIRQTPLRREEAVQDGFLAVRVDFKDDAATLLGRRAIGVATTRCGAVNISRFVQDQNAQRQGAVRLTGEGMQGGELAPSW